MNRSARDFHSPLGFARFYAPLAATSLMLTATNPLLTGAVARSADPIAALAGFAVAFSLCGVLYSPLLVVQQVAATRILEGGKLGPVSGFGIVMGVFFSGLAAAVAFWGPLVDVVFVGLIGLSGQAATEAGAAMRFLWPVPLLTAVRCTHQGRLVAGHRTAPIAMATGLRTVTIAAMAFLLAGASGGAWIGGAAFTVGLGVETALCLLSPTPGLEDLKPAPGVRIETLAELLGFSSPLMLNVLLWWATPLLITALLARTADANMNIAAFAVVEAVAWFLASPVGQLQHVSIALVDGVESHKTVRPLAGGVAVGIFLMFLLVAIPPIRDSILGFVYDPSPELLVSASAAFPLAVFYPLLYGHRQYFQGLFIRAGRPGTVGLGAILRMSTILILGVLFVGSQGGRGAVFGVGLALVGLIVEGIFLERLSHRRALPGLPVGMPVGGEAVTTSEGGLA